MLHVKPPVTEKPFARVFFENLFSLSQTQRRNAHEYKRWAIHAEREGRLEQYRRYRAESDRLWNEAKWHLGKVKEQKERMQ